MDRRTVLAIALCFLIYVGWQKYYIEPRMPKQVSSQTLGTQGATNATIGAGSNTAQTQAQASNNAQPVAPARSEIRKSETRTLMTGTGPVEISDAGKILRNWKLKNFRLGLTKETENVDLESVTNSNGELEVAFDDPAFAYLATVQGTFTTTPGGALQWKYEDANVRMTREFGATEQSNYLDFKTNVEFKTKHPNFAFVSVTNSVLEKDHEEQDRQILLWSVNSLDRVHTKKAELKEITTPVKYIGSQSRYFLLALINQGPVDAKGLIQPLNATSARGSLMFPVSGNSITIPLKVFFGPKELDVLRSVDPALDNTVDFGWFTVLAYPILKALKWLYGALGNYGVAIIILTLVLKIVTYPLAYKSMKSMKEMAKIQPQLARLRERYKDDKEALNREMLNLMRTHGYNPMAGCFPMLIQMPVFFALYRVLYSAIELLHAPFALWIKDLSAPDPFYVTPVVMSVLMFVQQKLQPNTATDPAQQKMMQMMPLIFGAFMLALPSGLTLYMLVNALATIIQQFILNKKLGIQRGGSGGGGVAAA